MKRFHLERLKESTFLTPACLPKYTDGPLSNSLTATSIWPRSVSWRWPRCMFGDLFQLIWRCGCSRRQRGIRAFSHLEARPLAFVGACRLFGITPDNFGDRQLACRRNPPPVWISSLLAVC